MKAFTALYAVCTPMMERKPGRIELFFALNTDPAYTAERVKSYLMHHGVLANDIWDDAGRRTETWQSVVILFRAGSSFTLDAGHQAGISQAAGVERDYLAKVHYKLPANDEDYLELCFERIQIGLAPEEITTDRFDPTVAEREGSLIYAFKHPGYKPDKLNDIITSYLRRLNSFAPGEWRQYS